MTKITWTIEAEDYQYGAISLSMPDNMILHIVRPYEYLRADRELKPHYTEGAFIQDIPWDSIPTDIQAALAFIDNYTKQQIDAQVQALSLPPV